VSLVVALGEAARVGHLGLGGALVLSAEDAEAVRRHWRSLPEDVALVILTERAAAALAPERTARPRVLRVVMPS
jgi:hypothetical protein